MRSENLTPEFVEKYIEPFLVHNTKRKYLDTRRFSPVIYGNDKPAEGDIFHHKWEDVPYKSESERSKFFEENNVVNDEAWWQEQKKRCLEGYIIENATNLGEDIWIPGRMYFFLNFWAIKRAGDDTPRKGLHNPRFLDVAFEKFFLVREYSIFKKKNNMWQKRRQIGWTENSACDVGFEFTFFKDSQSVVVAGEDKYTFNFMNFITRGLKYLSNTEFHVQVDSYRPTEYIKAKYRGSEIYGRTALNNAEAVSSLSPSLIYFEESGIWQKGLLQKAYDKVNASLEAEADIEGGVKKTGYGYILGTGGLAEDGVDTAKKMFYNPKGNDFLEFENIYETDVVSDAVCCFVPAYYFKFIDEDGNSDTISTEVWIHETRSNKSNEARYTFITEFPLKPSESFMSNIGGYFGKGVIQMLNERATYILSNKAKFYHKEGYLKWVDPGDKFKGVEFVEDSEEKWCHIFEPPRRNEDGKIKEGMYIAATDSYDQDEAYTSTSDGSVQIFKPFIGNMNDTYNKYVARITERPKENEGGASRFYEWVLMLTLYYNAINLIEHTKILIFDYFTQNRMEFMLKKKPEAFLSNFVDESKSSNKYGIDASTKLVWLKLMKDYLTRENIDKMDDVDQIQALAKYKYIPGQHKYNCDITISSSLCQVAAYDNMHDFDQEEDDSIDGEFGVSYVLENGEIKQVIV